MSRQFFELRPGETLAIGDSRVTLEAKTGQRARLKVESTLNTTKNPSTNRVNQPAASPSGTPTITMPRLPEDG